MEISVRPRARLEWTENISTILPRSTGCEVGVPAVVAEARVSGADEGKEQLHESGGVRVR